MIVSEQSFFYWKFLVLYLDYGCMSFDFTTQITLNDFLFPIAINKNIECKTTTYIPKCWERSVEKKYNINFIIAIKIYFLINIFSYILIYMVQTFLKILWRWILVPRSERHVSSALLSKTWNISSLSIIVYYNTNSFFLRSLLHFAMASPLHWIFHSVKV